MKIKSLDKVAITGSVTMIVIWLVSIVGWIMNVRELTQSHSPLDVMAGLRIVGVFVVPLGSFLGLFF
jgi:hypothetical protein